jgi:hypothetical protein
MEAKITISEETYAKIKKWKEKHSGYKDDSIDEVFESFLNIGFYAYINDGFDGSVHLKEGGDFGINC